MGLQANYDSIMEARQEGRVIDAMSIPIIFGMSCCGWCDLWSGDCCNTKHAFCPKNQCMTSPHYACPFYEED
jgi:hypothetical protein